MPHRRQFLLSTAALIASAGAARGRSITGVLPWEPNAGNPPQPVVPGEWLFFTDGERRAVEAIVDRLIPPDPDTPGGKDAGCAVFIDRQLAGGYGHQVGRYVRPPFQPGTKQQGPQSETGPAQRYRSGLAALDEACRARRGGKPFSELTVSEQDDILKELDAETLKLKGADGKAFFDQVLTDAQQGFFADPIYGGNRDMVSWRMIGYPGARYDYRDWVQRHNEKFPLPPVSISGRADWSPRRS
jgi:gluconate 2-dehydrogenase gamma chain